MYCIDTMGALKIILILTLYLFPGELLEGCQTPQYLQFGKSGIIHCDLNDTFSSVFWYDSVNILDDEPVVTFSHLIKGGHGYESGEFDITQDGSLLILDVGLKHEKNFSMARFASFDESPTVFTVSVVVTGFTADGCASPQYLTYGRKGVVHCFFQNLENVFWYNSTQALSDSPIVTYGNSAKGGHGYESGEFDIFTNGSLVINDVRLVHDNNFTVAFSSLNEVPVYFVVHVIVTVKYLGEGPVIEKCNSANTTCFIEFRNLTDVSCIVEGVRPAVSLKWLSLTRYGYHKVSFDVEFINNNLTFTSFAVISNASTFLPILSLLVCRAEFAPGVMQRDESLVLVHNNNIHLPTEPPVMKYVLHGSTFELNCSSNDVLFLVWKRSFAYGNQCQSLMFAFVMDNSFISKHQDNFELKRNGSLVLHQTHTEHDGFYCCIYGDGFSGDISKYKVITYVKPIPAYPVIEGCASRSACELDVQRKGNLTCTMTGVRPAIKLKWKVSNDTSSQEIYFLDHISAVTKSGETFSITLTSSFSIPTATQITLICGVAGSISDIFPELSLVNLTLGSAPVKSKDDSSLVMKIVVPLVLIVAVLIICGLCLRLPKVQRVKKTQHAKFRKVMDSSDLELNVLSGETRDLKKRLINQIKQNYQRLHHAVHPIPFIRYRLFGNNTVFVDGCLEKLATSKTREKLTKGCQGQSHGVRRTSVWKKLGSYSDIMKNTLKHSTRLIIEGQPGYGKSTITLQMAHDWCSNVPYLEDVEIFILLRLGQLREVQSLYQAIQKFILPWNSKITETDIKDILDNSESLVIVLDGYDEYRVNEKESKNFVTNILKGENFQNARVILTTTPSVLPNICGPQTDRIRLTGFDDKAKDEYFRKAVVDDEDAIKGIKKLISENFILNDLCQAPFFFTMVLHMCQEAKSFKKLHTASGFFKVLMQCFHEETRWEPMQLEKLAKTRDMLNKEAFESLHGKRYWESEKLRERLGEGFYYHCVRAGILVEEEVCETSYNFECTELRKVTTVRFFHHLFCEWHAAQYLEKMISKFLKTNRRFSGLAGAYNYNSLTSLTSAKGKPATTCYKHIESLLSEIEFSNLHFIYRFTCGLSAHSAVSITEYLQNKGYRKYFIMLCIMEHEDDEKMMPSLSKLCSTDLFITSADNVLQQKTTVEMLKIASGSKIPITQLRLLDSVKRISDGIIQLQSECQLPPLATLKELEILITEGNLTMREFEDISNYVLKCLHLETLLFSRCVLPKDLSKSNALPDLKSRYINVMWSGPERVKRWNYQRNEWEVCSKSKGFCFSSNQVQTDSSHLCPGALDFEFPGSEVTTFTGATEEYIQMHFRPINQAHRVPPLLFFNDGYKRGIKREKGRETKRSANCRIDQLSYYSDVCLCTYPQVADRTHTDPVQSKEDVKNIQSDRRSLKAVEVVGNKFIEYHKSLPGGMFVFSNLEHQKYLANMKQTVNNDESLKTIVTAEDRHHDIIVIHRKIGVILIHVKGCIPSFDTKTKKDTAQGVLMKVIEDKIVFYESNRDLEFIFNGNVPVYGFAAAPFLQKSDIESLGLLKNHSSLILTESDLKNLHKWLEARVFIPLGENDFVLSENEYMLLCGRYVGLLSQIPVRTFEKGNKKIEEKIKLLLLTPDQMALVNESEKRFLCVCGDYGTGKSTVLVEKAKKLVEEDNSSIALVISCSDIDNDHLCKLNKPYQSVDHLIKRFISVIGNRSVAKRIKVMQFGDVLKTVLGSNCNEVTKITPASFYQIILEYINFQNLKGRCHLFLDEVLIPLFLEGHLFGSEGIERWENINAELPEGSFCWIAVRPYSYLMSWRRQPSKSVPTLPGNFKWYYLDRIMRNPTRVHDLVKVVEDHVGHGHGTHSFVGHTFEGPKPLLVTLPKCSCPEGENIFCKACCSERLESSLTKVRERFDFVTLPVIIVMFMFHCGDHLLSLYQKFQTVLQNAFSKFDVKLEWNTMYGAQSENPHKGSATISVVDQHTFIGCETRNVMCIDIFGMHQWFHHDRSEWSHLIVNRCSFQYIHINWPEKEAGSLWLSYLQGYESYRRELEIKPWDVVENILTVARASRGLCVKSLMEKNLFEELIVNWQSDKS